MKECPKELIDAHWGYVESILLAMSKCAGSIDSDFVNVIALHYQTAFAHGWKHAKEESETECVDVVKDHEKHCVDCDIQGSHQCVGCTTGNLVNWKSKS